MRLPIVSPPWFVRKTYGYGWTPATWQGWACIAFYVGAAIAGAFWLIPDSSEGVPVAYLAYLFLISVDLVLVSWLTGEKPRWQWGKR